MNKTRKPTTTAYRKALRMAALLLSFALCFHATGKPAFAQSGDGTSDATEAQTEAENAGTQETEQAGEENVITMVGKYDSADLACVVYVNEADQKITLHNHDTGRNYTVGYDNTTRFTDASGRETGPQILREGDPAYVTFLKSSKHLNSLKLSYDENFWRYEDQRNYTLPVTLSSAGPTVSSMATISGKRYLMDVRTLVLVEGKQARPSAIVEGDLITAWGEGNEVYCVKVTRGHGYLRLSNDTVDGTSLVGAWIELGNSVIRKISPRMLVTAPEGTYTLYIIGNGANYSTEVTIERGKETVVDTRDIPIEKPKEGTVRFSLIPEDAKIRVDDRLLGEEEDSVTLEYGLHTLELTAEGYDRMFRYLRVGSPNAVVRLELERSADAQITSAATNATSAATSASSATSSSTGNPSSSQASSSSGNASSSGSNDSGNDNTDNSGNGVSGGDNGNNNGDNNGNQNNGNNQNNNGDNGGTNAGENTDNGQTGEQNNTQTEEAGQEGVKTSGRIYVDAPSGAAFYLDGNFIGFVPVSFEKTGGIHTVTLSRQGRRTISYNIELDNDNTDRTFNFPALEPE